MIATDYIAMILVLSALTALILLAPPLARVFLLGDEDTRKFVHLIMGLSALSFPWAFSSALPLFVLLAVVSLFLFGLRKLPDCACKRVLFGVQRRSLGEIFFPLAVTVLFVLAGKNYSLYVIPVAVLALADSLAALVGTRIGVRKYRSLDGSKTVEGSITFFVSAFLCSFAVLSLTPLQFHGQQALVSLILALVATACEGMAFAGLDNLLVPMASFYTLNRCRTLQANELYYHAIVLLFMTMAVLMCKRRSTLEGGATLAVLAYGFAAHAMGGFMWMALPFILFVFYRLLLPVRFRRGYKHTVLSVISVAFGGLVWLLAFDKLESGRLLFPYALGLAINGSIIASAHMRMRAISTSRISMLKLLMVVLNSLKSFVMIMAPLLLVAVGHWQLLVDIAMAPLWIFSFTLIFLLIKNQNPEKITSGGRWFKQGLCSSAGSLLAFAFSL